MGPADITSIVLDEVKGVMDISVTTETLAQSIGKSGQNVRLCSQLTGWKLNVVDSEDTSEQEGVDSNSLKMLMEHLDVDEGLAKTLFDEGYKNLDHISSANLEDLAGIAGFDEEMADLLVERSKEALLALAMEKSTDTKATEDDLLSVEGVDISLAMEMNQNGIKTREDLAEQSVDELVEVIEIEEEKAAKIIMKAREHWFDE